MQSCRHAGSSGNALAFPADFESPSGVALHCGREVVDHSPHVIVDVVRELIDVTPVVAVVQDEENRRAVVTMLCDWGLPAQRVPTLCVPDSGPWLRDYAPAFVRRQDGSVVVLVGYHNPARPGNNDAAHRVAAVFGVPVHRIPILFDGGNFLSNGRGLAIMTDATFTINSSRFDQATVRTALHQHAGVSELVVLHRLVTEPSGHVDLFAAFVAHDTVVVGAYDPAIDPINAGVLDENARILSRVMLPTGPLKVVRIPMPSNRGGIWRTYTNVVFGNRVLLVPGYASPERATADQALEIYRRLMPGWKVSLVDCSALIHYGGALRCITMSINWMDERLLDEQVA